MPVLPTSALSPWCAGAPSRPRSKPDRRILLSSRRLRQTDEALPRQHHRLGLVIDFLAALLHHQRHERRQIVEHQLAYQLVRPLANLWMYKSRRALEPAMSWC